MLRLDILFITGFTKSLSLSKSKDDIAIMIRKGLSFLERNKALSFKKSIFNPKKSETSPLEIVCVQ